MNLETTVAHLKELEPRRRGIQRTYSRYRELTEEAFGSAAARNVECVVSDIFTCIGRRIVGPLCQEDMVGLLEQSGWRISDSPHLTDELIYCHDLASVEQRGKLSGHSQFEGAFSLKGLNAKYFYAGSERTVVLLNDRLPGSVVALSNLGDPPDPETMRLASKRYYPIKPTICYGGRPGIRTCGNTSLNQPTLARKVGRYFNQRLTLIGRDRLPSVHWGKVIPT